MLRLMCLPPLSLCPMMMFQAEFLRELMTRVQRYTDESVERSAALGP